MGIAYFERNQLVNIDGACFSLLRKTSDDSWQLENRSTGQLVTRKNQELLQLYTVGSLKFDLLEWQSNNSSKKKTRKDSRLAFDLLSKKLKATALVRRMYVARIRMLKLSTFTAVSLIPLIDEIWRKNKKPKKKPNWITVYRWWRRYEAAGFDVGALVSKHNKKGNRKRRYSEEVLHLVETAVDIIYLKRERQTIADTLEYAVLLVKRENDLRLAGDKLPLPTARLIKSYIETIPVYDCYVARYGRQAAIRKFRAVIGHVQTYQPLERVEIDHTLMNVFVVDDENMLPLGRPWLTVCIDDYTRNILGFNLSFEPPSHLTVANCLRQAILPKTDLHDKYPDIKNTWDCYGVMQLLVVDNGLEFHGIGLEDFCYAIGSEIQYCPRKTPWLKGKIERFQGTLNRDVAHGIPGTTFHNIFEKDDYDTAKKATITLSTLRHIITLWIVDYYHQKPHRALQTSPAKVWQESNIDELIPLPESIKDLDSILGRVNTRTITAKGVELNGLFYNSLELRDMRVQIGDSFKATIRINDENIGTIFVVNPETDMALRVPAINRAYAEGLSSWQHEVIKRYANKHFPDRELIEALAEAKEAIRQLIAHDYLNKKVKSRKRVGRYMSEPVESSEPKKDLNEGGSICEVSSQITVTEKGIDFEDEEVGGNEYSQTDISSDQKIEARRKLNSSIVRRYSSIDNNL